MRPKYQRSIAYSILIALLFLISLSDRADAHASEQGFVLLLPTDLYIASGCAAVAVTILLTLCVPAPWARAVMKPASLRKLPDISRARPVISLASTAVLFTALYIGVAGPRDPLGNLLPLLIWTVWWVGITALHIIFGNLWAWINPWTGLIRLLLGSRTTPPLKLPQSLGVWPAVFLILCFNIFAMADIAPNDPDRLAKFVFAYWLFTAFGIVLFGQTAWLSQVECFSIFFRLIGSVAPLRFKHPAGFGTPGWASIALSDLTVSHGFFCIVLLASGSFDGLHETFWWLAKLGINPLEFPGRSAVTTSSTLGLLASNLILVSVFAAVIWLGNRWANADSARRVPLDKTLVTFALCILPIAYGYHLAHFLVSFLVNIQYTVAALSDPMATGAQFLGYERVRVTTGFLNTQDSVKTIWLTQAGAVVVSHVIAVLMAHAAALELFETKARALKAETPLSIFMLFYTFFGLWLLAAPRGV